MKKLIHFLLHAGIKDTMPQYLKSKIHLTNLLALIIVFLIVVPYIGITFIFFKPLLLIPIICALIGLLAIFINYLGFVHLGRFILALLPFSMPLVYFAYLMPPGSPKYLEMYFITIAFSFIPFLVFDIREKWFLASSVLVIAIVFVFGLDWINAKLVIDGVDARLITHGPLGTMNLFMGILLITLGVTLLSYLNYSGEKNSEALIKEMETKTNSMKGAEDELKEKIALIEKVQAEEKQRNWATQGIAEVGTLLRSNIDSQALYDKITSYITQYINANQCGLFMVVKDEQDEVDKIVLQSCFAYDRKKYVDKHIEPGQGLVGQAYLEKSTIYLKDVPNGYTSITSGMGESTPSEVLIVPLMVNEVVEGVFEFASFTHFEPHVIEFVEHLGETLASFIGINRINERTKILLDETQEQAEQMRSQEEEMRQNMEELSATQEEMARNEQNHIQKIEELTAKSAAQQEELKAYTASLEGQMKVIEKAALVSKTNLKGEITYVNDLFCEVAGYTREELIGKNHNIIRHPDMPKAAFKDVWKTIGSGKIWTGKVKNKTKSGGYYWVDANIGPIMGDNGKPKEYIGVRYLVTDYIDNDETLKKIREVFPD